MEPVAAADEGRTVHGVKIAAAKPAIAWRLETAEGSARGRHVRLCSIRFLTKAAPFLRRRCPMLSTPAPMNSASSPYATLPLLSFGGRTLGKEALAAMGRADCFEL